MTSATFASTTLPLGSTRKPSQSRRAFTLLELLVVFVIIAILVGLALMVGHKVVGSSKYKATQNVLQTLDQSMEAYIQARGGTAARFPDRFVDSNKNEFPLADGTILPSTSVLPSAELTVELLLSEPASAAIIKTIPAEFITKVDATNLPPVGTIYPQRTSAAGTTPVQYTQVKDAWGAPVRFVHPAYQGIYNVTGKPPRSISVKQNGSLLPFQLGRMWVAVASSGDTVYQGDGDGGLCAGGRPYFYSTGPDLKPATVEDNVYSVRPQFDAAVKAGGQ